jgi:hypothetical protein
MTLMVVLVASLVASCGGSAAPSSNVGSQTPAKVTASAPAAGGWTGMGSPLTSFETEHPKNLSGCPAGTCFGTKINNSEGDADEFVLLTTTGGRINRVDGYTQAFSDRTSIADAKAAALGLMPKDTRITSYFIQHDSVGSTCAFMNIQSRTLGKWFSGKRIGDAAGVMSIEFSTATANGKFAYKPSDIESASVSLAPINHSINC